MKMSILDRRVTLPVSTLRSLWLRLSVLMLASVCLPILSGCNSPTAVDGESGTSTSGKRQFITIGTAPGGGVFSAVGNAIANVVDANKGELNWSVSAKGTKGTQENIRNLESGDIEFGMANAAISYFATTGEGGWADKSNVRVVATLAPNVGIFVTTEATGIKTVEDLKGKRVVLGPAGAGFEYFLKPLLAAHGLSYDDLEVINGNYLTAAEMIADGKVDAAFMGGAIPIPAVQSLCSTQDVVFVQIAEGAPEKLRQQYPFYFPVPVPQDKFSDLKEDMIGINVGNMHLITHEKVDEEVVYNFTKTLYENREKVAEAHPAGKAINPKNVTRDTGTPYHPGAIRYYKEASLWPSDSAE